MIVVREGERSVAARSASAIQRALACAELEVAIVREEGVVLGAFQRASEIDAPALSRRSSGGAAVRVGPGTVHAALALPRVDALAEDCEPRKILNRYARPLLKALTKVSLIASYSGRDWVSVAHRPCAYVAFAHESKTQRASFEAFVAVWTRFDAHPRASYLGKEPATLEALADKAIDPARVADEIVRAYASAYQTSIERRPIDDAPSLPALDAAPWPARVDEAIGPIFADRSRLGGELMASYDALQRASDALARAPDDHAAIAAIIEKELGPRDVALEGVRSLASLWRVIEMARGIG